VAIDDLKKEREETKWFPLFTFFEDKPYGYLATYHEIEQVTGIDLLTDRGPLYQAQKNLLLERKRALDCVRSVGYRVAEAVEHIKLAKDRRKRGVRQFRHGVRLIGNPDRSRLTGEEAQAFDRELIIFTRQFDTVRKVKISGITFQPTFTSESARRADEESRMARVARASAAD
jgi:hypothetical protein